ncbi:MAG: hypothetical protein AAF462_09695 [Thermodesulfobacteriota bacterium]
MKKAILIILFLLLAYPVSGDEINERELYGDKRQDCRTTKRTDQGANIMQCPDIRADDKEIEDTDNLTDTYSPDDYNDIY